MQFDGHSGQVWCVACSPDGRWGLSSGTDRIIRLWDLDSGAEVRRFEGHTDLVGSVAFWSHQRILSAGDRSVRVWDASTGGELCRSPELPSQAWHAAFVNLVASPSVLTGTEQHGLQLWRLPRILATSRLTPAVRLDVAGLTRSRIAG